MCPPLLPLLDMVRVKVTLNGVGNGEMVALRIDISTCGQPIRQLGKASI